MLTDKETESSWFQFSSSVMSKVKDYFCVARGLLLCINSKKMLLLREMCLVVDMALA